MNIGDFVFLLFVFVLGIDLGAGLYETRIVVPLWSQVSPAELGAENPYVRVAIDAGMRFWALMTPATGILAVATVAFALASTPPYRTLRLFSAVLEICVIATTLAYFIPTLKGLFLHSVADRGPEQAAATVRKWVSWNRVRIAASVIAWCAGLIALAR